MTKELQLDTQHLALRPAGDQPLWLRRQLARLLYDNCMVSLAGTMLCALVLVTLLWNLGRHTSLLLWLGGLTVLTFSRLLLQQRFERLDQENMDPETWLRRFGLGILLSGLLWGSLSVWLFPTDSLVHQIYIAFVLAGICAGAVTVYAPLQGGFLLFAIPALLPFVLQILAAGRQEEKLLAVMVALFVLMMNRIAMQAGRTLHDVLELQIRNAELTRALHHRATHDSLVNLVNQGEFQRRLERLVSRADTHQDFSLIFIDLDLFKAVNDNGGHAAGDALLREVARIISSHTRARDTAARVGGDEFALLLEGCPPERALEIAEHVRRDIHNLAFEYEGRRYSVGASLGVSYGKTGLHSADSVLRSADAACYAAKESGRNRVRMLPADDMFKTTGRFNLGQMVTGPA